MSNWAPFLGLPLWLWLFVVPTGIAIASRIFRSNVKSFLSPVWRILDRVYFAGGIVSALFLITILLIIIIQMITRWSGVPFQGSTEFAGYAMAAASFFALAHALTRGAHIRVSIFLNMNKFTLLWLDALAMWIAAITATYFSRFAIKTNFVSKMIGDRTQGQDMVPEWVISIFAMFRTGPANWGSLWSGTGDGWVYTPVWLPQLPMSIGTVLLAIALWDSLTRLLVNGESHIKSEAVE
jgi:TRAP-type C4-dicarboxylate transport system permease small subunit